MGIKKIKQRGVTLIELMAVIVVIAIIFLIVRPQVMNMITQARIKTSEESLQGYIRAVNIKTSAYYITLDGINKKSVLETGVDDEELDNIGAKEPIPDYVKLELDSKTGQVIKGYFCINNISMIYENNEYKISDIDYCGKVHSDDPSGSGFDKMVITIKKEEISTNEITIEFEVDKPDDVEKFSCEYGYDRYYGYKGNLENNKCTMPNLDEDKEYFYRICVTDKLNVTTCKSGSAETSAIKKPTFTYESFPITSVNGYRTKQIIKVDFTPDANTDLEYYIKSTREGMTSVDVEKVCTGIDKPENCTSATNTKKIDANKWYKVADDINVTYDKTSRKEDDELMAMATDGNKNKSNKAPIAKIDASGPDLKIDKIILSTDSIQIKYTITEESEIDSVTCSYGTSNGVYNKEGTIENGMCNILDLDNDGEYFYKICTKDKLNNEKCIEGGPIKPQSFINPIFTYSNEPKNPENGYYKKQVINITYPTNATSTPAYYVKTTVAGKSTVDVIGSCGSDDMPGNCSSASGNTLSPNVWYKISSNASIIYDNNPEVSSGGEIKAVISDGTNKSNTSVASIPPGDVTAPVITYNDVTTTTNSAVITYNITDAKSGVGTYTCMYSTTSGVYNKIANETTKTNCTIVNLTKNTTYYYQICAYDKLGNGPTCYNNNFKTKDFAITNGETGGGTGVKITPEVTPAAINGYSKKQVTKVEFNSTNVTNPTYYIRSMRNGVANTNTVQSCGNDTLPKSCEINRTTSIRAGIWYRVSGNINVTYDQDSNTENENDFYAMIYDGTNYSSAAWASIIKIEVSTPIAPVIQGETGNNWSATPIDIRLKSAGSAVSGVEYYEYYISNTLNGGSSNTPASNVTVTGTTNDIVHITENGVLYIWYRTKSIAGNRSPWSNPQVIRLDTNAPSKTTTEYLSGYSGDKWQNNIKIKLSATDNINVNHYEIDYTGNGVMDITTSSIYVPTNGFNYSNVRFRAVDDANNKGEWSSSPGLQIKHDPENPSGTTIKYNSGGSSPEWQNNINITLSATDNIGVETYEIDWNGDGTVDTTTVANFIPWNNYSSSSTRFRAVDYAGNKGAWSIPVAIHMDTENPSKTTTTFTNGGTSSYWQNGVSITLSATDNVNVKEYEVSYDGNGTVNATTGANFVPANGYNHTNTKFRAVDYAGNKGTWSDSVSIKYDNVKPTITNVTNDNNANTINSVVVYVTATDDASGIPTISNDNYNGRKAGVYCYVSTPSGNNNNWKWYGATYTPSGYKCDIDPYNFMHFNQNYHIKIYAWDYAGNGGEYGELYAYVPVNCTSITPNGTTITFGECSATCDGGTQKQYLETSYVSAFEGGGACDPVREETGNTQECNTQSCCSSTYSVDQDSGSWGECSATCGGGTKKYSIDVYYYSTYNNQYCGKGSKETDSTSCNTQDCCSDTEEVEVSSYDTTCSAVCGGGTYKTITTYKNVSKYTGEQCGDTFTKSSVNKACNTQACDSGGDGCVIVSSAEVPAYEINNYSCHVFGSNGARCCPNSSSVSCYCGQQDDCDEIVQEEENGFLWCECYKNGTYNGREAPICN